LACLPYHVPERTVLVVPVQFCAHCRTYCAHHAHTRAVTFYSSSYTLRFPTVLRFATPTTTVLGSTILRSYGWIHDSPGPHNSPRSGSSTVYARARLQHHTTPRCQFPVYAVRAPFPIPTCPVRTVARRFPHGRLHTRYTTPAFGCLVGPLHLLRFIRLVPVPGSTHWVPVTYICYLFIY